MSPNKKHRADVHECRMASSEQQGVVEHVSNDGRRTPSTDSTKYDDTPRSGGNRESPADAGGGGYGGGASAGEVDSNNTVDAVPGYPMNIMFREQSPMPFELAMLEAILQEVRRRGKKLS